MNDFVLGFNAAVFRYKVKREHKRRLRMKQDLMRKANNQDMWGDRAFSLVLTCLYAVALVLAMAVVLWLKENALWLLAAITISGLAYLLVRFYRGTMDEFAEADDALRKEKEAEERQHIPHMPDFSLTKLNDELLFSFCPAEDADKYCVALSKDELIVTAICNNEFGLKRQYKHDKRAAQTTINLAEVPVMEEAK